MHNFPMVYIPLQVTDDPSVLMRANEGLTSLQNLDVKQLRMPLGLPMQENKKNS